MIKLLATFALAAAVAVALPAQAPPPARELAQRIQTHYDTVKSFTADFTQTARDSVFGKTTVEHGTVQVLKPSQMRWSYTPRQKDKKDHKEFVADGLKIYWYVEADKAVDIWSMPKGDDAGAPLLFLAGRGDLVRDFTAAVPAVQPASGWRIDLTPKSAQKDFTSLSLIVDPRTLALVGFITATDQETQTFDFQNLRENVTLPPGAFRFVIPPGVEPKIHDAR